MATTVFDKPIGTEIGQLSSLTTSDNTNLVNAINSLNSKMSIYITSNSNVVSAYNMLNANETTCVSFSSAFMQSLGFQQVAAKGTAMKVSTYIDCEVADGVGVFYTLRFTGSTGELTRSSLINIATVDVSSGITAKNSCSFSGSGSNKCAYTSGNVATVSFEVSIPAASYSSGTVVADGLPAPKHTLYLSAVSSKGDQLFFQITTSGEFQISGATTISSSCYVRILATYVR